MTPFNIGEVIGEVIAEAAGAESKFGPFTSTHEALGVLTEEVAELVEAIRSNKAESVRREAIQVSAVSARLAQFCTLHADFALRSGFYSAPNSAPPDDRA